MEVTEDYPSSIVVYALLLKTDKICYNEEFLSHSKLHNRTRRELLLSNSLTQFALNNFFCNLLNS